MRKIFFTSLLVIFFIGSIGYSYESIIDDQNSINREDNPIEKVSEAVERLGDLVEDQNILLESIKNIDLNEVIRNLDLDLDVKLDCDKDKNSDIIVSVSEPYVKENMSHIYFDLFFNFYGIPFKKEYQSPPYVTKESLDYIQNPFIRVFDNKIMFLYEQRKPRETEDYIITYIGFYNAYPPFNSIESYHNKNGGYIRVLN